MALPHLNEWIGVVLAQGGLACVTLSDGRLRPTLGNGASIDRIEDTYRWWLHTSSWPELVANISSFQWWSMPVNGSEPDHSLTGCTNSNIEDEHGRTQNTRLYTSVTAVYVFLGMYNTTEGP